MFSKIARTCWLFSVGSSSFSKICLNRRLVFCLFDIIDEIAGAGLMLPIAVAHLRWPLCTTVSCSDATPDSGGICTSTVSRVLARGMFETAEHKGEQVYMHRASQCFQKVSNLLPPSPLVSEFVKAIDWGVVQEHGFAHAEHVNLRELGEIAETCKLEVCDTSLPCRRVNGADSNVGSGAWAKGRSSSVLMTGRLRLSNLHK